MTISTRCRKAEAWRISGKWTTVTSCAAQSWFLHEFDVANARVGAERNPLKTEVTNNVNDMDAAPPELAVTDGSITLGVAVGSRQFITDQLLSKADVIRAMHERVQLCQDPQTECALLRESMGVSRINRILRVHGHTILQEQSAAAVYDEIGQRSLERLFPGLTEDSMTQATLSAGQSGIGYKRARDIAAPAHLGALKAAKLRIHAMIRDAVWAGLLPEHPLETRLAAVIETATSTYLSAHLTVMSKERRSCMFRRQPRQQTKLGSKQLEDCRDQASQTRPSHPSNIAPPPPKMKTAMTWTSQRPGRAGSVRRSSKRSFRGSLIGLDSAV